MSLEDFAQPFPGKKVDYLNSFGEKVPLSPLRKVLTQSKRHKITDSDEKSSDLHERHSEIAVGLEDSWELAMHTEVTQPQRRASVPILS